MEKTTNFVDPRMIRLKHQTLLQDYQALLKETKFKMRKLEMMKRKRLTLEAEVRFLRRRYKHLKQDQSLETDPNMSRLLEGVPSKPNSKRKKLPCAIASVPCSDLQQKSVVCNEKEALASVRTNSVPLPDLNGDGNVDNKVPDFDLNLISREEEEEPEANGDEHMVTEATKNAGVVGELKLPICRDVEKEMNRGVKRKVTWQDPVALTLSV